MRPSHVQRYARIVRLLFKFRAAGSGAEDEFTKLMASEGAENPAAEPVQEHGTAGADLARELESMGPTYVKLGQILAARADLLPMEYLTALARLQDRVAPFPFLEAKAIVESELGLRLSKAFSSFEETPIAAASLGQVHRATLRDGRVVAVKVQRPGVRQTIADDIETLAEVAAMLDRHSRMAERVDFAGLVDEFRKTLLQELDYREEAKNLERLGENLRSFAHIQVPQPVGDYTSSLVLTMEYVRGKKVTKLGPLGRLELQGALLADELFHAYLKQILVDGFFHADPHPGNVFVTDEQDLALLDLGMVGRVPPVLQNRLLRLLLALGQGRGEEIAAIAEKIGTKRDDFDGPRFAEKLGQLVAAQASSTLERLATGRLVLEVSRVGAECGIRLPSELALLGKTLLQLDEIGRCLDPDFDPNEAIRKHAAELTTEHMRARASSVGAMASLHELKEFMEELPARSGKILDLVAKNELRIKVDAIDEQLLMQGFQKVANRIATGLVLAALIVGAAMLIQVPTEFRILGYPGLAIVCFTLAAVGGLTLIGAIAWADRTPKRRS